MCPKCAQAALEIEFALELSADGASHAASLANWDENTFQLAICSNCGLRAAALYQESRRGSLEDETWRHFGVVIPPERYTALAEMIRACPDPANRRCQCAAHRTMESLDINAIFQPGMETFPLLRP